LPDILLRLGIGFIHHLLFDYTALFAVLDVTIAKELCIVKRGEVVTTIR
jgi:hypothetical protein